MTDHPEIVRMDWVTTERTPSPGQTIRDRLQHANNSPIPRKHDSRDMDCLVRRILVTQCCITCGEKDELATGV